jgi:drug/metabolite transporter (DMT)-like permease
MSALDRLPLRLRRAIAVALAGVLVGVIFFPLTDRALTTGGVLEFAAIYVAVSAVFALLAWLWNKPIRRRASRRQR